MAKTIKKITVNTSGASYDITIGYGVFADIHSMPACQQADRVAVIISKTVYDLHKDYIIAGITEEPKSVLLIYEDSEENKSFTCAGEFLNRLLTAGLTRKSIIIAVGGGVTGDFSGFLASLYMRGIAILHVPTTLLAMVDSSIGGKVAVNLSAGKNIAGSFHQPAAVLSDLNFLDTLDSSEIKNGISEILKHAIIGEMKTFEILNQISLQDIRSPDVLIELVYYSAMFKASVVSQDERETGIRAVLNFGHTIAHGLESFLEYKGISHGEAVAIGMRYEADLSHAMGYLSAPEVCEIKKLIEKFNLIRNDFVYTSEDVLAHMKYDKKNSDGHIKCVLLEKIGKPIFGVTVDRGTLKQIF